MESDKWLKENGVHWYDLGGIDPEHNPGVFHFKKGAVGNGRYTNGPDVSCSSVVSSSAVRAGFAMRQCYVSEL